MALLLSPSRGVDAPKGGTRSSINLLQPAVQEEFRSYLSERIREHAAKYSDWTDVIHYPVCTGPDTVPDHLRGDHDKSAKQRGSLEEIIMAARKLREGVVATGRKDAFAVDAYELSVLLSVLCGDQNQLSSSITLLVQELYPQVPNNATKCEPCADTDMQVLLGKDAYGVQALSVGGSPGWRFLFMCLWMLESLCSLRPNFSQQYLERRQYVLAMCEPADPARLEYVHHVYLVLQGQAYMGTSGAFPGAESMRKDRCILQKGQPYLFWLQLLTRRTIPHVRTQAWSVLRKAYMQIPVDRCVGWALRNGMDGVERLGRSETQDHLEPAANAHSCVWLASILYTYDKAWYKSVLTGQDEESGTHQGVPALLWLASCYDGGSWSKTVQQLASRLVGDTNAFALKLR